MLRRGLLEEKGMEVEMGDFMIPDHRKCVESERKLREALETVQACARSAAEADVPTSGNWRLVVAYCAAVLLDAKGESK